MCLPNTLEKLGLVEVAPGVCGTWSSYESCKSQDEISSKLLAVATDEALVAAAKSGDRRARAELWERHSNRAFKMAYRMTRNREDPEDVIQDAWTNAYVHLKSSTVGQDFRLGSRILPSIRR
jgi:sigma-70-like protein